MGPAGITRLTRLLFMARLMGVPAEANSWGLKTQKADDGARRPGVSRTPPALADNCTAWGCTCQGFADNFGTYAGRGFGCGRPHHVWWTGHGCHADAHCPCCKGPACALPGAAPCICPDGPNPPPLPGPVPPPPPVIPAAIICPAPLEPEYICKSCRRPVFSWDTLPVFVHVSEQDTLAFDSDDLAILTKFPVVTIEK